MCVWEIMNSKSIRGTRQDPVSKGGGGAITMFCNGFESLISMTLNNIYCIVKWGPPPKKPRIQKSRTYMH